MVPHPQWWRDQYEPCVKREPDFKPLRVQLPQKHAPENLLAKSSRIVQPLDTDTYGHVNNGVYSQYAADGLLVAQRNGKLLGRTAKEAENGIISIESDFVSECRCGDVLDIFVYRDTSDEHKVFVNIHKSGILIYGQIVVFDPVETQISCRY